MLDSFLYECQGQRLSDIEFADMTHECATIMKSSCLGLRGDR